MPPVEFRWFHEGHLIRSGTRVQLRQLTDLSVLQIQQVIEADGGRYECEVEDARNSRDRHATQFVVLGKFDQKENIYIRQKRRVTETGFATLIEHQVYWRKVFGQILPKK